MVGLPIMFYKVLCSSPGVAMMFMCSWQLEPLKCFYLWCPLNFSHSTSLTSTFIYTFVFVFNSSSTFVEASSIHILATWCIIGNDPHRNGIHLSKHTPRNYREMLIMLWGGCQYVRLRRSSASSVMAWHWIYGTLMLIVENLLLYCAIH